MNADPCRQPAVVRDLLRVFDADLPLERARTIPASWYTDPDFHAAERCWVFGNSWQALGRAGQVAHPGEFFTANLAGEPVAVVRGGDGVLRAFANVCRHRAAPVLTGEQGQVSRLRCRYHGWTYDLAGRLRGTPEFDGVADFWREDNGLVEHRVATWGPLVWAHLGSQPPSLEAFLSPLPERVAGLGMDQLRFVARRSYDLACNWKVYVDNYLDGGYHVNTVHLSLAGVLDYSRYRTEVAGWTSVQTSPLRPPNAASDDVSAAAVRSGGDAHYWWVFPNFMLNLYPGVMDTNLVLPLGPDRCRVVFDFWFADTDSEEARRFHAESIAVSEQIQREDVAICEEVQRGLASRAFESGRFSVRREAAGFHFHRLLAQALQAGLGDRQPCVPGGGGSRA